MSIWVETTSESTSRPSRTTAAAVSSHEVSRPNVNMSPTYIRISRACGRPYPSRRLLTIRRSDVVRRCADPTGLKSHARPPTPLRHLDRSAVFFRADPAPRPRPWAQRLLHRLEGGAHFVAGGPVRLELQKPRVRLLGRRVL